MSDCLNETRYWDGHEGGGGDPRPAARQVPPGDCFEAITKERETAAKDAEIAELHNMIEELTDALHPFREWFGNQKLIDRAKEMIRLKEEGDMT